MAMTREKAFQIIEEFSNFLKVRGKGRRSISPAKVFNYLEDQDVKELLGEEKVDEIWRAAELLV